MNIIIWICVLFSTLTGYVHSSSPYTPSNKSKLSATGDAGTLLKVDQKRGWKDNTMQVWGKRSVHSKQYNSAELNDNLSEGDLPSNNNFNKYMENGRISDKRKWGQNSMQVWGKRTPGARATIDEFTSELSGNSKDIEDKKRKWGENSMAVWGKRYGPHGKNSEEEKRKWGQNSMAVWGKRVNLASGNSIESDKRKWSDNSMAVWGKRLENPSTVNVDDKRKWSDNSMKVWGKREVNTELVSEYKNQGKDDFAFKVRPDDVLSDASIDKRKWADNTMQVWGKRTDGTSSEVDQHSIAKRSLEGARMSDAELWQSLLARNHNRGLMREGPKRNWETNTMRVWGKRSWAASPLARSNFYPVYSPLLRRQWQQSEDAYAPSMSDYLSDVETEASDSDKRAWSSDNDMRVWG